MTPEVNLYIYAVFPQGQTVQVGRLLSRNLTGRDNYEGFFKYAPAYLTHPLAYAIDPVHLPLQDTIFEAGNRETGIHSVFDDSLPDAWGRHILARKGGLERSRYAPAHLLGILGGAGLGRLLFSSEEKAPPLTSASITFSDIAQAIDEAGRLEDSIDVKTIELRHLLACGSSAGGARPKVLTALDTEFWIAKFASRKDIHPELAVSLEEAGLTIAALAGMTVPAIKRINVGDRGVLLIRRFDISPNQGRNAIISFRTLLGVEDQYNVSYADLAHLIRQFSFQPQHDLDRLFRQMIVNILMINTDDHLQNFAMLHTEQGWCLSPAYDIVPNIYQTEQILKVNGKHGEIRFADILAEGQRFGLSRQLSKKIALDVLARIAPAWENIFTSCGVPEAHTSRLKSQIRRGLELITAEAL